MKISDLPLVMVRCLLLTILIEGIIAIIIGIRNKKDILNVILVNIVTNPIVVSLPFVFLITYGYKYYRISFYILEIVTLIVEGLIYYKVLNYKKINPFIISLILNGSSYLIGEIINHIWYIIYNRKRYKMKRVFRLLLIMIMVILILL